MKLKVLFNDIFFGRVDRSALFRLLTVINLEFRNFEELKILPELRMGSVTYTDYLMRYKIKILYNQKSVLYNSVSTYLISKLH